MVTLDNGGLASASTALVAPPIDLADLVEHSSIDDGRPHTADWRIVPDASPHLIAIATTARGRPGLSVVLVGARSRFEAIDTSGRSATIAIRLKPGTLPVIAGLPASDFMDRSVPIGAVFSTAALRDLELSADAPAPRVLGQLLRLLRRARRGTIPDLMPRSGAAGITVNDLAFSLDMPSRSLYEQYQRHVGLSPKRVLRILRLHKALQMARQTASWADVAHGAGFADQPHLTREMKQLLGETPTAWAARGSADSFKTPAPGGA